MTPSIAGDFVTAVWLQLPDILPGIMLDAFQLMPDHIHGIIVLGTEPEIPAQHALGEILRDFKGRTTTQYYAAARAGVVPHIDNRLWQRGYHDRIIRTERELEQVRAYIASNPGRWWEREQR
jgi:REP element-mobilizing transposase RayT